MIKMLENTQRLDTEEDEIYRSTNNDSDYQANIDRLQAQVVAKDDEINSIISGFERQLKNFHKTLNQQMQEIDEKNEVINDLKEAKNILEQRVNRLKQAASGLKSKDNLDEVLESEQNLINQLMITKKENEILQESLISAKVKWAQSEHEKETLKLQLINMSEELAEISENPNRIEP